MTNLNEQEATRRLSRRAMLGSLAGGAAGLALLPVGSIAALARSTTRRASATYTRGQTLYTYKGMRLFTQTVDWSPDGTLIASGSEDRSVQIWSPESPKTLYYYYGNGAYAPVVDVAWSPDGRLIADGTATDFVPTQSQVLVWVGR